MSATFWTDIGFDLEYSVRNIKKEGFTQVQLDKT